MRVWRRRFRWGACSTGSTGHAARRSTSDSEARPSVRLITPTTGGKQDELVLPGTMQAWFTAHIYARVGGYVHAWTRNIGADVGQDAPLATIETFPATLTDQSFAIDPRSVSLHYRNRHLAVGRAGGWVPGRK